MDLRELTDEQLLIAHLLAAFIDHGPSCQFTTGALAEALIRISEGRFEFEIDTAPDGAIIMRLQD